MTESKALLLAPEDTRHGTPNGYNNLGCRCDRCRTSWAVYRRVGQRCPECRKMNEEQVKEELTYSQEEQPPSVSKKDFLTRTDLRNLGLGRRAIDAVFRALPVVKLPGYGRPMIRTADYEQLISDSTYRGDRVRPTGIN